MVANNVMARLRESIDSGTGFLNVSLGTSLSSNVDSVSTVGKKATYRAAGSLVLATMDTALFHLGGSASKTLSILELKVSLVTQTATLNNVACTLQRRSSAYAAGTAVTRVQSDSADSASAADVVCAVFTAQQAIVAGSTIAVEEFNLAGLPNHSVTWRFGDKNDQALLLRGTGELITVYLDVTGGGTPGTGHVAFSLVWTEE